MKGQWRLEGGGKGEAKGASAPGGTVQGAAFEGAKIWIILKFGRFWRIGVCFLAVATDQPKFRCIT